MATIALYQGKINQMPGLIKAAKQSVESLKSELSSLQKKASKVDSGVCDMSEVISSVETCTKTQENRIEALDSFQTKLDEYVNDAVRIDNKVAETVNKNKKDFYEKYDYLKPDCEKSRWEKFCDACKKVGEWCKEHWKLIVTVVLVIVAVAVIIVTWGAASGPILILAGAAKGLVMGALIGGLSGGINSVKNGGSFLDGFEDGAFSGAISGFIMGGAMAGLGQLGAALGPFVKCGSTIGNIFQVTAKATTIMSLGMGAFDTLALVDNVTNLFGGGLYEFNAMLHESKVYNFAQVGIGMLAAFTGGVTSKMSCFVEGTMVLTVCGLVAIENIKAGDMVLSADMSSLQTSYKKVLRTYIRKVENLVHLTLNGETIVTTEDHPFYVNKQGFLNAAKLCVGTQLIDSNGGILCVEQVYHEHLQNEERTVYNFQVEDNHTYYVSNQSVLVHNAGDGYSSVPVPERTTASNGIDYESNPKHTPGHSGNRPNAGVEPKNSLELFGDSVPSSKSPTQRYTYDSSTDTLHRFSQTNSDGSLWHWSGSTNQGNNSLTGSQVPNDIKNLFNLPKKGW